MSASNARDQVNTDSAGGLSSEDGPWLGSLNGFHDNIISGKSLDWREYFSSPKFRLLPSAEEQTGLNLATFNHLRSQLCFFYSQGPMQCVKSTLENTSKPPLRKSWQPRQWTPGVWWILLLIFRGPGFLLLVPLTLFFLDSINISLHTYPSWKFQFQFCLKPVFKTSILVFGKGTPAHQKSIFSEVFQTSQLKKRDTTNTTVTNITARGR